MKKAIVVLLVLIVVFLAMTSMTNTQAVQQEKQDATLSAPALSEEKPSGPNSVVGPPTLSTAFLDQVLSAYHSPAAGQGLVLYQLGERYRIDPAYALAFFMHESLFGRLGEARKSLSLGNLRCIANYPCNDGYAWFPSWSAGFQAWYVLIAGSLYVGAGLMTVEQIIPRYAPSADHNDEQAYIKAVERAVRVWRGGAVFV